MPKPEKPTVFQPVRSFVSPNNDDFIFFEVVDSALPKYKTPPEFGTPHPNFKKFPDHKLVFVAPTDPNEPHAQKWYYAADRGGQEGYNFVKDEEKVVREFIIPRDEYLSEDYSPPELAEQDPTFEDYGFATEELKKTGDSMLDTYFVTVVRTYVNTERLVSQSESGSRRGEDQSTTTLSPEATAQVSEGGIIISRASRPSENQLYKNTENRLYPRTGVQSCKVKKGVGFTEVTTVCQELTEPQDDESYADFSKSLITTDVDNQPALWEATKTTRQIEPAVGGETSKFLGGGRAYREVTLVEDDNTVPQEGFHVISSKVNPIGNGQAVKDTLSMSEYPILVDYKYDSTLDGFVKVQKEVVPTADNPEGSRLEDGSLVEVQSVDKWRSIKISTSGMGVANTRYLPGAFNFRFPPVLLDARWIGAWAYAINGTTSDYDQDIALVFDLVESYSAAVSGRIIQVTTNTPADVIGQYPTVAFKPQSHTVGMASAYFYSSNSTVWAKANARTWQTPMAINSEIILAPPTYGTAISIDAQYSGGAIPATTPETIPQGWVTIGASTNRLKLGYYEVIIRQINSPGV